MGKHPCGSRKRVEAGVVGGPMIGSATALGEGLGVHCAQSVKDPSASPKSDSNGLGSVDTVVGERYKADGSTDDRSCGLKLRVEAVGLKPMSGLVVGGWAVSVCERFCQVGMGSSSIF